MFVFLFCLALLFAAAIGYIWGYAKGWQQGRNESLELPPCEDYDALSPVAAEPRPIAEAIRTRPSGNDQLS